MRELATQSAPDIKASRLLLRFPRPVRYAVAGVNMAVSLALAACGTAPSSSAKEVTNSPDTSNSPKIIYLLQGPHDSNLNGGIKDAVDLGPPDVIHCSAGERKVLDAPPVIASASGTVIAVGKDNDRNDPLHSVVLVRRADGTIAGDMHLAEMGVKVGDPVIAGKTKLGKFSCEVVPKGGQTTGMHDHRFVRGPNGEQIPIDGEEIFGFTIHADDSPHQPNIPYKGTMTKPGEETRTSDPSRCGPEPASIDNCGGIRNDININEHALTANPKSGASPLPTVPAITSTIAVPKLAPPAEAPKAVPTPKPFHIGDNVVVTGTTPKCFFIRVAPGLSAENIYSADGREVCYPDGAQFVIRDGPVIKDDYSWWRVREDPAWVPDAYLNLIGTTK